MKIAVTAASGQLGKEIVKATIALLTRDNVIGLARTPDKAKDLGVEIRPGDYNDKSVLEQSLGSVDVVLLVSGMDIRGFPPTTRNALSFSGMLSGTIVTTP